MIAFELDAFQNMFLCSKNIAINISRVQANDSIMCGYFCIWLIDFILKGKRLLELDYINLPSPNKYEKDDKVIQ